MMEKYRQILSEGLRRAERLHNAATLLEFDKATVCPPKGREQAGETCVLLEECAYKERHSPEFVEALCYLHAHPEELNESEKILIDRLYRDYLHTKNITDEKQSEFDRIKNKAWMDWNAAKEADDFSLFAESLSRVIAAERERVMLWECEGGEEYDTVYDRLLSSFEPGCTISDIDSIFADCAGRIGELLSQIERSKKRIRTDFLFRSATDAQQEECAHYILELLGFDWERGTFATSEHPFSELIARDDIRLTTHYYPDMFTSSLYSVLHECGHSLFEQLQPEADHEYFLSGYKTMGMHESVSRFYENIIGRSKSFIHLIYPKLCEIFPQILFDVTEQELFEAVNIVQPSLIRMDADELTYTLHIVIRYELEKAMINDDLPVEELPALWREKYEKYLGVTPSGDRDGVLQDVHWSSDFGYFPTYALGNLYNAMYKKRMEEDLDLASLIENGDFKTINSWMESHIFAKADRLSPAEWIRDITGRDITADDFIEYLRDKYSGIYGMEFDSGE